MAIYSVKDKKHPPCGAPCIAVDVNTGEYFQKVFYYDTVTHECRRAALDRDGKQIPDPEKPGHFIVIIERRELRFERLGELSRPITLGES